MNKEEMRKAFSGRFSTPNYAIYNEDRDAYCWADRPRIICPSVDDIYEAFCVGVETRQTEIDQLKAEIVDLKNALYECEQGEQ